MIISRTPFRISFFGGGTDYPDWYLQEGGAVLSTTIDKHCYLSCRFFPPFFEEMKHRIVWSHIEGVSSISEILHPAVRAGLRYLGFNDTHGLEIHHQGDLPARSGIGSSSSFTVGLMNALTLLKGETIGKHELALKAIELEQNVLKETVGSQDQVAAAYGGLNIIRFHPDSSIDIEPVELPPSRVEELESKLLLVYTGASRLASEVAAGVTANLHQNASTLRRMHCMVDEATSILRGNESLDTFGGLLHEGWTLKQSLSEGVSNSHISEIYDTARAHGALGGKLLGAGSSGFMLLYVPPERQQAVKEALPRYLWVPFAFENVGSAIIYNDSETAPY